MPDVLIPTMDKTRAYLPDIAYQQIVTVISYCTVPQNRLYDSMVFSDVFGWVPFRCRTCPVALLARLMAKHESD